MRKQIVMWMVIAIIIVLFIIAFLILNFWCNGCNLSLSTLLNPAPGGGGTGGGVS